MCSAMGHVIEPLTERGQEGFSAVKRRSGLETEMIILVFFKNCPATSFSCDLPLSGWWHAFKSRVPQFLLTAHMHTLSQVLLQKEKCYPIVHFTTGNVEVKMLSGPGWHLWVKMHIQMQADFHSRDVRHNDTYKQTPKHWLWTSFFFFFFLFH